MCILDAHSYSYKYVFICCTRDAHLEIAERIQLLADVHHARGCIGVMCVHTHTISVCTLTLHAEMHSAPWLSWGGFPATDCESEKWKADDWKGDEKHLCFPF